MKAKWIELWSTGANPGSGTVVFKNWYQEKAKEYRIWMYQQLINAVEQGTQQPQLLEVSYQGVKDWVDEMKKLSNTTLRAGTIIVKVQSLFNGSELQWKLPQMMIMLLRS